MKSSKLFFFSLFSCFIYFSHADELRDTTQLYELDELVVSATFEKESALLAQRPVSGSFIQAADLQKQKTASLKELSSYVPNFFIPDYGSKITSSVYVRGIGSRIDQPAVGLYVDGIPMLNKSAFDFDFYEIQSIEILRGPQSTLYGRNTLGGIINIRTKTPEVNQRYTTLFGSYGNYNDMKLNASHYNYIGNVAFSVGGYFNRNDGFFTNQYTGKKIDDSESAGGKLGLKWNKGAFSLYYTLNYDYTQQGGYPYAQYDTLSGNTLPINYNDYSGYSRDMANNSLLLKWNLPGVEIASATGYQFLKDKMEMDQDFTEKSVFTLKQKQKEHAFTEEIIVKSTDSKKNYKWLFGLFGFYKDLDVQAPVTMKENGVSELIEEHVNNVPVLKRINAKLDITDSQFLIASDFEYPTYGLALFHQSVYDNLFVPGLSITGGIRLDYEKATLRYNSNSDVNYRFSAMGAIVQNQINTLLEGEQSSDFVQVLPKIALKYDFDRSNNVYISVSKGYKAGGFNTQMFADIIQKEMQDNIKEDIYNQIKENPPRGMPTQVIDRTLAPALLSNEDDINIKDVISYDPEYSWNYELGGHFSFFQKKLYVDIALFYIDCRDQQITVFSDHGMGRMMKNAGQTESYGIESSIKAKPFKNLTLNASYGYTHAVFKKYEDRDENYAGNFVPFAPQNTFSAGGDYTWAFQNRFLDQIVLQMQYSGAGKIYWTEKNDVYQDFYGTLNGSLSFQKKCIRLEAWAKNIFDTSYNTFYFENRGNSFLQKGKPFQIGGSVKILFGN